MIQLRLETTLIQWRLFARLILSYFDWLVKNIFRCAAVRMLSFLVLISFLFINFASFKFSPHLHAFCFANALGIAHVGSRFSLCIDFELKSCCV